MFSSSKFSHVHLCHLYTIIYYLTHIYIYIYICELFFKKLYPKYSKGERAVSVEAYRRASAVWRTPQEPRGLHSSDGLPQGPAGRWVTLHLTGVGSKLNTGFTSVSHFLDQQAGWDVFFSWWWQKCQMREGKPKCTIQAFTWITPLTRHWPHWVIAPGRGGTARSHGKGHRRREQRRVEREESR